MLVSRPCGTLVKNPPAKQEIQVQILGQEDTLEEKMTVHENDMVFLPGKSRGQRNLVGYSPQVTKSQT